MAKKTDPHSKFHQTIDQSLGTTKLKDRLRHDGDQNWVCKTVISYQANPFHHSESVLSD